MIKNYLTFIFITLALPACMQQTFVMDYDDAGGLESWQLSRNGEFVSNEYREISFDELVNTIASNVLTRIQHITYCSQINDTTLNIYTCDDAYENAFFELQAMQTSLHKAFKNQPLTINIAGSPVTLNSLSQPELINTLYSDDIAFNDAEKALMLYFVLGEWMKDDAATGIAEALALYHYQKAYPANDDTAACHHQDEIKALHSWMLGSYLYANNLPPRVDYTHYKTAEAFFNAFIDSRDDWSQVFDSAISQSILHEDVNFRLPVKMLINSHGDAVIYRLHKKVAANNIDLQVGDKVLGFNDFIVGIHSDTQQNASMLKALNSDKKFHWKIKRGDKTFTVTTIAKNEAAPIEDILITDTFKSNHQTLHYLKLDSFVSGFEEPIDTALSELSNQNGESLIIDLRANGGGSNSLLLYLLNTLFPDEKKPFNVIVRENGLLNESPITLNGIPSAKHYKHTYILLDAFSLSASEQFANAVQHRDDVTVLSNTNTYGKRISNHTWQGNCGKSYQLTTSFGINGLGKLLPKSGIKPDIKIENAYKNLFFTSIKDPFIEKVMALNNKKYAAKSALKK